MRRFAQSHLMLVLAILCLPLVSRAQEDADGSDADLRVGIIGLDTSHAPAFAKLINAPDAAGNLAKMRVVAAFPGGSSDIAASRDRVDKFTEQIAGMGIEIVDSIEALLGQVDAVLLESVDGRKHLEQVLPVFRAGKPVFIDKPLAADLTEAIVIDLLAKKYDARWFSSSSLRFSPSIARFRAQADQVRGAAAWSPCDLEVHHMDLAWYGIHGVETLYTAMGTGCQSVTRTHTDDCDVVTGRWENGRIGTFRGLRGRAGGYGLVVFGKKEIDLSGKYEGYAPLVTQIADFFVGGAAPVSPQETLEMFTFMAAADESRAQDGAVIPLAEVRARADREAQAKLADIDP